LKNTLEVPSSAAAKWNDCSFRSRGIKDFTVAQLIGIGLPVSIRLGLSAMLLALSIGITLGIWAALR
jgi:ABC-type dipeptide/oligopeptide/nickel transport system permease component